MKTQIKPQLKINEEYNIELYPKNDKVRARYVGKKHDKHVFRELRDCTSYYTFLDDYWITDDNGTITYTPISSVSITRAEKGQLKQISELINILKELEEF